MEIINLTPDIASLEDNTFNLGEMKKGTVKNFSVVIKNALHKGTGVSCGGCTTAKSTQKGNDIQLDITFKANGSKSTFTKTVTQITNTERIQFTLTGKIV